MLKVIQRIVLFVAISLATGTVRAANFFVTTGADSGAGSLRQAIFDANASAGADAVVIDAGPVQPITQLPTITGHVNVFGNNNTIDGSSATGNVIRLRLGATADFSGVYDLTVTSFGGIGVYLLGSSADQLTNCSFECYDGQANAASAIIITAVNSL